MRRIRILLADDHTMICAAFQKLLEPQYEVVARVGDGLELLKVAADLKPDLVLLDVGMPLLNGLDAGRELKKLMPSMRIIFLTMNTDLDIVSEALKIGASGYLLKDSHESELLQAIHDAVRGMSYLTPQIALSMEQSFIRNPKALGRPKHLTGRQREVLQLLAEGRPMKEIAYILHISRNTVRFHKYRLMDELEITTDSELVRYAVKHSMVSPL